MILRSGQGYQGAHFGRDEDSRGAGFRDRGVLPNDGVDPTAFEIQGERSLTGLFLDPGGR